MRAKLQLAKVGMISSRVILILSKTRPLMPNSNWHLLNNSTWVARLLFVFIQFGSSSIPIKKFHKSSQVCQGNGWIYAYALLPWPQKLTMATFLYHIGPKIPSFLLHSEHMLDKFLFMFSIDYLSPKISCQTWYLRAFQSLWMALMCKASGTQKCGFFLLPQTF